MIVALRPALDADEPFLMSVYASTRAEELARAPWSAEQRAAFVATQYAAQRAHHAEHFDRMSADVVLVDGAPAGRLLVERRHREIRIVDIALLAQFRGRGAGGALLAELIDEATEMDKRLSIHVERENRARSLYERLGFRPVGETGAYLRMEWDGRVRSR